MKSIPFQAVILDLDGVITQTAHVHAQSWQRMFDDYLKQRSATGDSSQPPFDLEADYRTYLDGKPRYDGVKSFLESRDIELPWGSPDDPPGRETICGLGNRKNDIFLELLDEQGVDIYDDTVEQIHHWRSQGLKTAVVSSSRNCKPILEKAGLLDLFDVKVDGVDSERLNLDGKPAPDIFLEAAQQLNVEPQAAVAVEDAISGVKAGRAGNFGLVVGVARRGRNTDELLSHGADQVVEDMGDLQLEKLQMGNSDPASSNALQHFDAIAERLTNRQLALFTDYDGTLTPIVDRPEDAVLTQEMRSLLQSLSHHCRVAVVSGRDLADVRQMVGLDNLYYAGSHGFDIAGPEGLHLQQAQAEASLPALDQAETRLQHQLQGREGVHIERKTFAIAVHYRRAKESPQAIESVVDEVLADAPSLRKKSGKKIFELQPDVPWDKGRAIAWLMDQLKLQTPQVVPLYLGDDTTDEDAFRALRDSGITVRVGDAEESTQAQYALPDPDAVGHFFRALLQQLKTPTPNHG
jgi:trehalose 6-phosphate phosphatase